MAFCIDSRKLESGDIFIPIQGNTYDGHDFIPEVIEKGGRILDVSLEKVCALIRRCIKIPIIAVTGSSGKTTTKDRIFSLLSSQYRVLKTHENQNNEIGVPLTLFQLVSHIDVAHEASIISLEDIHLVPAPIDIAVIEMGMRGLGEIEALARCVQPSHVIITQIGTAHLGRLGCRENIRDAKAEIFTKTPYSLDAFINLQDDYAEDLRQKAKQAGWNIIEFIDDPLPAIAEKFEVHFFAIPSQSEGVSPHRMQTILHQGITIIDDTYNANPDSMAWALNQLRKHVGRKMAVLGDMLELGEHALFYHQQINIQGIDVVFSFGECFGQANKGHHFKDKRILIDEIKQKMQPGDVILVKGSRGMTMEDIVSGIISR